MELQTGDPQASLPEQTKPCYSQLLDCSGKSQTAPPPTVCHLAVGRWIKAPKPFHCRDEQINHQMHDMALLCRQHHLAPAKISGRAAAAEPGAIASSSSCIDDELIKALPLITHLLAWSFLLSAFNSFDIFIIVEAASRQFDLGIAHSSKLP